MSGAAASSATLAAAVAAAGEVASVRSGLSFLLFGDWGFDFPDSLHRLKRLLEPAARVAGRPSPSFIIALGDNFYPDGIATTKDFRLAQWSELFAASPDDTPWLVLPGNHDYCSSIGIRAQLRFSDCTKLNPWRKWIMGSLMDATATPSASTIVTDAIQRPDVVVTRAAASESLREAAASSVDAPSLRVPWGLHRVVNATADCSVDLFLLDTCAVQWSVRKAHPTLFDKQWPQQMEWLAEQLRQSRATWKIVCGHHPLFTLGKGHQDEARCLRGREYTCIGDTGKVHQGMGLLDVLHKGGADLYVSGHEHWYQLSYDTRNGHTLPSVVCGNSMETHFWRGRYQAPEGFDEMDDDKLVRLIRKRMLASGKSLAAETGKADTSALPPIVGCLDEIRAGKCPELDPDRSLYSCQPHASDPVGAHRGITRIDADGSCLTVSLVGEGGVVLHQTVVQKQPSGSSA